jgi:excisionase family DNA binding protein
MDRIVIPLGNGDWIAVTAAELAAHKAAALALGFGSNGARQSVATSDEPLCTSAELAVALGLPKTRIEQATRMGEIPSVKVGRYHRYRRREVMALLGQPTTK